MAFTGRATYDNADAIEPDVAALIYMYSRTETPFLDFIGDSARSATQPIHSFMQDGLRANSSTINESGTFSDSDTTLTVTSGAVFSAYDTIMIDDEILLITAVSTNNLTVVRGYGSSTAATHADGSTVYRIASGNLEGADVQAPRTRTRTLVNNYCHIIEPDPSVVSLAEERARKRGGIGSEQDHQLGLVMLEAMLELERAAIYSTKHSSTPQGSDNVARTMQGLRWYPSTNVANASSATLSEDYFLGRLAAFYANGAKGLDFCLAPPFQKLQIDTFKRSATRFVGSDTSMQVEVTQFVHSFSTKPLRIILSPWVRDDELLFGDSSMISIVPFIPFMRKNLAEAGFYSKMGVHGEYTIEVGNELATGLIKGLATS